MTDYVKPPVAGPADAPPLDELVASSQCPHCGKGTPHPHPELLGPHDTSVQEKPTDEQKFLRRWAVEAMEPEPLAGGAELEATVPHPADVVRPLTREELEKFVADYQPDAYKGDRIVSASDFHRLVATARASVEAQEDAARLNRLIATLGLRVQRDEPGEWTCWLELPCIPTRSKTTDVRGFIDSFARFDKGSAESSGKRSSSQEGK